MGENACKEPQKKQNTFELKEKSTWPKNNRASIKGGFVHIDGSISMNEHAIRMVCFS